MVVLFRGSYSELSIPLNEVQKFRRETHFDEGNAHLPKSSGVFSHHEVYLEAFIHIMGHKIHLNISPLHQGCICEVVSGSTIH